MKATLTPYLSFNGSTKEAMEFYKSVLGGTLTMQTFGESGMPVADEDKDKLVHALLKNDTLTFMASDGTKDHVVKMGDNICMSIVGSDEELLTKYFNELSKGGKVTMKLEKQFWGDTFGSFTDKFGVNWMINIGSDFQ
ncbi:MAG TPA: VOC family protein [Candidatus Saccharimonadales bacterium]|nr:VOC family protein [Candidatus Saccharimonadales bacterium]